MEIEQLVNDNGRVRKLNEKQLNILKAYDIIYLVVFSVIALVAIHNVLRYIRRVISPANKFMLVAFYCSVILMCAAVFAGSSINLRNPGELVYEICNRGFLGSTYVCLVLEVAEMVVIQIELYTIIYTMHQLRYKIDLISSNADVKHQVGKMTKHQRKHGIIFTITICAYFVGLVVGVI